ncbi:cell division protein FtsQ/DivIB [Oceanobacillus bengalensis]|uniref:Cell division protein DivIB n=1 Tax=Oceanobacillus bengalensis TaxID=1435466 RepID=A0A494Z1E5_9BACI|nr:cell division protein FtsQ/DivIB [Oceanobacillus bengalensis]RKQ16304.1 cell division protein FtsQ/DivIB [Oceanobacillus bengalensis]
MSNKNIVSIEDRIPKLKQARKKKANRRLIFYLLIFFFLISIIVYLQSPLSHIKTINLSGNSHVTDEEIIRQSELTMDTNIWMIDIEKIESLIQNNPIINQVKIDKNLPWTININITENEIIGYSKVDRNYFPVLGNGVILTESVKDEFTGNAPILLGFTDEEILHKMADELNQLPESISKLISEIHWSKTDDNKNKILLYMSDGYIVDGTIRNFAEKMEVYPSIVSQLDPESQGIIHIGVGVYFESFDEMSPEEAEESSVEEQGEISE